MATLSGAERIRAITDEDGMFKAFDSYPWKSDKMFIVNLPLPIPSTTPANLERMLMYRKSGLYAILGDPNTPNPQGTPSELVTHARVFYYAQRIGVTIDFAKYKDWLARNPDHAPPDILPEEYKSQSTHEAGTTTNTTTTTSTSDVPNLTSKLNDLNTGGKEPEPKDIAEATPTEAIEPALSWQTAAPKADLFVERKPPSQVDNPDQGSEPAYPVGFAEMLQMIQKGIPIPGIRQIPDTVVRDASVKPFGKRTAPKKPWEKDTPAGETGSSVAEKPSVVDAEFPPLDDEATPQAAAVSKDT
ncbi:hypothetical protein CCHL11_01502 [Colletotrichum chlorophyti]|uniref:Uncharacterized protein n=1 Tax=Colletotrichum chlorophyti TaxID=708187 RepID=A0A1Q8RXW8_9PEZI|nr:hypothetical protein CCHL11_01502 [Colletotrichum chlorophyti]